MQFHQRVEPVISGWLWGYNYRTNVNNPSTLSCHASGTAIDLNAPNHPNGARGTFSNAQVGEIRAILNECQGAIQWGGDYTGTPDEMHFEIIVNASRLAVVASTLPTNGEPPVTDDDVNRIAGAVWDRMLQPDGANTPAWALLVQSRNNADTAAKVFEGRPDVLAGQSRDEAVAQTRNDVSALLHPA
jgi:hypothetical protein